MAEVKRVLVILSPWRQMGIYFLAILLGMWLCMKRTAQCIWTSSKPLEDARDSPPPCLVETNGGRHSYVKLKVIKLLVDLYKPSFDNLYRYLNIVTVFTKYRL